MPSSPGSMMSKSTSSGSSASTASQKLRASAKPCAGIPICVRVYTTSSRMFVSSST